jgi:hypothetical protein
LVSHHPVQSVECGALQDDLGYPKNTKVFLSWLLLQRNCKVDLSIIPNDVAAIAGSLEKVGLYCRRQEDCESKMLTRYKAPRNA